ncbi:hypothetical protein BDY19DRAFT_906434 [Irpex rosettiformis]|uniref:Uncharacterized protein n=1 Tax=Irpex rosettiformis TaxID=378272 RepID=A0ACB8U440_9APHY|nr:hypothetical protein BDY19DRAFT_906434 [Irpex rosettiformis]
MVERTVLERLEKKKRREMQRLIEAAPYHSDPLPEPDPDPEKHMTLSLEAPGSNYNPIAINNQEQPSFKNPEIATTQPNDHRNDESAERYEVYSAWIKDITNGEVIPETPSQPTPIPDEIQPPSIDPEPPQAPPNIDTPIPEDSVSNIAEAGPSTSTLTQETPPASQSSPEIDSETHSVSQTQREVHRHLLSTSQHLRRLICMLPADDPSQDIYQAAYRQATFALLNQRLINQGLTWGPLHSDQHALDPGIVTLTHHRVHQLQSSSTSLHTIQDSERPKQTSKKRKRIAQEFKIPLRPIAIRPAVERTFIPYVPPRAETPDPPETSTTTNPIETSVRIEPDTGQNHSPSEVADRLRDLRDETMLSPSQPPQTLDYFHDTPWDLSQTMSTGDFTQNTQYYSPFDLLPSTGLFPDDDVVMDTFLPPIEPQPNPPPAIERPPTPFPMLEHQFTVNNPLLSPYLLPTYNDRLTLRSATWLQEHSSSSGPASSLENGLWKPPDPSPNQQ